MTFLIAPVTVNVGLNLYAPLADRPVISADDNRRAVRDGIDSDRHFLNANTHLDDYKPEELTQRC